MVRLDGALSKKGANIWGASSLRYLLFDPGGAEVVVIDDRSLNKLETVSDGTGSRAPLATSIDVLKTLKSRDVLSEEEYVRVIQRLRKGGALFVPSDRGELSTAALKGDPRKGPSFEIRAVADYLDFARIRQLLQFPSETIWLGHISLEIMWAIRNTWEVDLPPETLEAASQSLLDLIPDFRDWIAPDADPQLQEWARQQHIVRVAFLGNGLTIQDDVRRRAYLDWVERAVIRPVMTVDPSVLEDAGRYTRRLLLEKAEELGDELARSN